MSQQPDRLFSIWRALLFIDIPTSLRMLFIHYSVCINAYGAFALSTSSASDFVPSGIIWYILFQVNKLSTHTIAIGMGIVMYKFKILSSLLSLLRVKKYFTKCDSLLIT